MLPIPPLAYATYAGTQSLRQTEEKTEQVKRAQSQDKDAAAPDRYEHSVESSEEVQPIHDEEHKNPEQQDKHGKHAHKDDADEDGLEHLDLTA